MGKRATHLALCRAVRLAYAIRITMAAWLVLASCLAAQAQRGAITAPRNLAQLSSMADRIVQGRVVTAVVEPHPEYRNLKTVVVTLEVNDVLKGVASRTVTFRQFIWDLRDIATTAGYRGGDEVLLFLNRPTSLGLVTPVGLEQGRFRVRRSASGEVTAINGHGNVGLFDRAATSGTLDTAKLSTQSRTAVRQFKQGAIPLSALKESTRLILQEQARTTR